MLRSLVLVACLIVLAGCAMRVSPPSEAELLSLAAKEEWSLLKRVRLYDDPALRRYLDGVARRLVGEGSGRAVRIVVVEDPTLAAFALPGRGVFIHTGLLSRVESEGQLAFVLAREFAFEADPDAAALVPRAGKVPMVHATPSPTGAAILGRDLPLLTLAAIRGHGPERERAVDAEALRRLAEAGYDGREAPKLLALLSSDAADRGATEIFDYGDPARVRERQESVRGLLAATRASAAGSADAAADEKFARSMRPVVRDNAALDIRARRFDLARRQLDRVLIETPDDPVGQLLYGELCRLRSQGARDAGERARDVRQARERYRRSVELDPTYAEPFRQLGLLDYQEHDLAGARDAFGRYLALRPDAPDAPRIREYLAMLRD
jgi:predicted Zn-dependent protease